MVIGIQDGCPDPAAIALSEPPVLFLAARQRAICLNLICLNLLAGL